MGPGHNGQEGVKLVEAPGTDCRLCDEGPSETDPRKGPLKKEPGLEQQGEVSGSAAEPESKFGENSQQQKARGTVHCGWEFFL